MWYNIIKQIVFSKGVCMMKTYIFFFVLTGIFIIGAVVWYFQNNVAVFIGLLAAALVWLILAFLFLWKEKRAKKKN